MFHQTLRSIKTKAVSRLQRRHSLPFAAHLIVGMVLASVLLDWLSAVKAHARQVRRTVYEHGFPDVFARDGWEKQAHHCQRSHWHISSEYDLVEKRSTPLAQFALVQHTENSRYAVLVRFATSLQSLPSYEETWALADGNTFALYHRLPNQQLDGYATRRQARAFLATQQHIPGMAACTDPDRAVVLDERTSVADAKRAKRQRQRAMKHERSQGCSQERASLNEHTEHTLDLPEASAPGED